MALKIRTGPKQNLAITSPRNMPTRTATGAGVRLIAFSTLLEERLCRLSLSFMWQGRQLAIQNQPLLLWCVVLSISVERRELDEDGKATIYSTRMPRSSGTDQSFQTRFVFLAGSRDVSRGVAFLPKARL